MIPSAGYGHGEDGGIYGDGTGSGGDFLTGSGYGDGDFDPYDSSGDYSLPPPDHSEGDDDLQ